jgi:hypothetical protein
MAGSDSKTQELNAISDTSLENAGRAKRASEEYRFYDENELEPDYSKPGNLMHKEDMTAIADGTSTIMGDLISKLKTIDIDCKTEKGPIQKEPVYYIDIKREEQKQTDYDQFFCEELKNKYSCQDTLSMECTKRGMKWNPFQYKVIRIPGDIIYHSARDLGHAVHWKKKRKGWHLYQNHAGWRAYLARHLGVKLEQIGEQIIFPYGARGVGDATHPVYDQWRIVFDEYEFGYNFRTGTEICEAFEETWSETCTLN